MRGRAGLFVIIQAKRRRKNSIPNETEVVRHVTGTGSGLLGGIPRVVVQISALTQKGPL
jgi:hypothetical protein